MRRVVKAVIILLLMTTTIFSEDIKIPHEIIDKNPEREVKIVESKKLREKADMNISVTKKNIKEIEGERISRTQVRYNFSQESGEIKKTEEVIVVKKLEDALSIGKKRLSSYENKIESDLIKTQDGKNYIIAEILDNNIVFLVKRDGTTKKVLDIYKGTIKSFTTVKASLDIGKYDIGKYGYWKAGDLSSDISENKFEIKINSGTMFDVTDAITKKSKITKIQIQEKDSSNVINEYVADTSKGTLIKVDTSENSIGFNENGVFFISKNKEPTPKIKNYPNEMNQELEYTIKVYSGIDEIGVLILSVNNTKKAFDLGSIDLPMDSRLNRVLKTQGYSQIVYRRDGKISYNITFNDINGDYSDFIKDNSQINIPLDTSIKIKEIIELGYSKKLNNRIGEYELFERGNRRKKYWGFPIEISIDEALKKIINLPEEMSYALFKGDDNKFYKIEVKGALVSNIDNGFGTLYKKEATLDISSFLKSSSGGTWRSGTKPDSNLKIPTVLGENYVMESKDSYGIFNTLTFYSPKKTLANELEVTVNGEKKIITKEIGDRLVAEFSDNDVIIERSGDLTITKKSYNHDPIKYEIVVRSVIGPFKIDLGYLDLTIINGNSSKNIVEANLDIGKYDVGKYGYWKAGDLSTDISGNNFNINITNGSMFNVIDNTNQSKITKIEIKEQNIANTTKNYIGIANKGEKIEIETSENKIGFGPNGQFYIYKIKDLPPEIQKHYPNEYDQTLKYTISVYSDDKEIGILVLFVNNAKKAIDLGAIDLYMDGRLGRALKRKTDGIAYRGDGKLSLNLSFNDINGDYSKFIKRDITNVKADANAVKIEEVLTLGYSQKLLKKIQKYEAFETLERKILWGFPSGMSFKDSLNDILAAYNHSLSFVLFKGDNNKFYKMQIRNGIVGTGSSNFQPIRKKAILDIKSSKINTKGSWSPLTNPNSKLEIISTSNKDYILKTTDENPMPETLSRFSPKEPLVNKLEVNGKIIRENMGSQIVAEFPDNNIIIESNGDLTITKKSNNPIPVEYNIAMKTSGDFVDVDLGYLDVTIINGAPLEIDGGDTIDFGHVVQGENAMISSILKINNLDSKKIVKALVKKPVELIHTSSSEKIPVEMNVKENSKKSLFITAEINPEKDQKPGDYKGIAELVITIE